MTVIEKEEIGQPSRPWQWIGGLGLRQRILLLLVVATLPGIAVAVFLATSWLQDQSRQIETSVARLSKLAAARHETVIENARVLLTAVAQGNQAADSDAECRAYLTGWLKDFPAFTSLTRFDPDGAATCATSDTELDFQAGQAEWFKRVREERNFVLGRYVLGRSGQPMLVAAYPLLDGDGDFTGAFALGIDLRWLDFLADTVEMPAKTTITAVNERGEILSHNTARDPKEGAKSGAPPSQASLDQMGVLTSGTLKAEDASGSPRVYGFQKTTTGDLVVAVGHTPYLEYAKYRDALINTLSAPLLVLVLALLAVGYASEAFVTRYVRSLTHTAEQIEQGDLSARSEIPYSQYEIGRLAAAFDSMAAAIEENQSDLEDLAEEREMLIRELNHRVKNNLQIVQSMLRGGQDTAGAVTKDYLKTVSGRVQTLAQIHHLLYEKYETGVPPLGSYVTELTRLLGEFYGSKVGPARIDSEVASLDLTIGQCVSFGLILNELVANAQKHAFPGGRSGRITIRLFPETVDGRSLIHLIVADDGVGLPADFDLVEAASMGSRIVRALARQLDGEVWSERLDTGTAMHLRFPHSDAGS